MTTSVSEFDRWYGLVSSYDLWLFPVRKEGKSPDVPKGSSWKDEENRLTPRQARRRIRTGEGNVGVGTRGDLAVIDVDDPIKAQNYISDDFLDTLVVETRSGNPHLYFHNDGVDNADIPDVMELRAIWRYVLVPGSYVPADGAKGDGLYKVRNAEKPAVLRPDVLPDQLKPTEKKFTSKPEPDSEGDFLSLPCVRKMFEIKFPPGGRRKKAGKFLSLAWFKDRGMDTGGFRSFILPFAQFQDKDHSHRPSEYSWLGTINRKGIDWNCREIRNYLSQFTTLPCGRCQIGRGVN